MIINPSCPGEFARPKVGEFEVANGAEAGVPQYNTSLFFGVMGPAGLPDDLANKLNQAINEVLKDPGVQQRLSQGGGLTLEAGSVSQFKKTLDDELAMWQRIAKSAGIVAK